MAESEHVDAEPVLAPPLSRELVLRTARAQLECDGVDGLSLRAVARELGVTAPALYLYVQDKADLLAGVATEHFERLAQRFEAVPEGEPLERVRALSRAYVEHARSSPALFRLMFRYPPTALPEVDAFAPATRAFDVAARATADAIDAGLLGVSDPDQAGHRAALGGGREIDGEPHRCACLTGQVAVDPLNAAEAAALADEGEGHRRGPRAWW